MGVKNPLFKTQIMSITKRLVEDQNEELTQEQFNDYWRQLTQMYDSPEYMLDYNGIADVMNFEFDLNLSDVDVKKYIDNTKDIDEEDARLRYKNLGL